MEELPSHDSKIPESKKASKISRLLPSSVKRMIDKLAPDTSPPPHFLEFANNLSNGLFPENHPYFGLPSGGRLSEGGYQKKGGVETDWYEVENGEAKFLYPLSYTPDDGEIKVGQPIWVDPKTNK